MTEPVTVAVDANGADKGPAEVARGAALAAAAGTRVLLFGPASEFGDTGDGVEVVDAPVSIAKDADPARAVRRTPDASIVAGGRGGRRGARGRAGERRLDGCRARCGAVRLQARPRRASPGARDRGAGAEGAVPAAGRRRERRGAARAPGPVRAHGRGVHGGRDGRRAAARGAPLERRGGEQGPGGGRRRARGAAQSSRASAELRRQRRGVRDRHRRGRRDRGRRLSPATWR